MNIEILCGQILVTPFNDSLVTPFNDSLRSIYNSMSIGVNHKDQPINHDRFERLLMMKPSIYSESEFQYQAG